MNVLTTILGHEPEGDAEQLSLLYLKVLELAQMAGYNSLHQARGAWCHRLDEDWFLAFNLAHKPAHIFPEGAIMQHIVLWSLVAIWHNGLPVGEIGPYGGWLYVDNCEEDNLITAIETKLTHLARAN